MKAFGFSVDPAASAVARDETSPALPLGPGIDLEQLSWGGESYGASIVDARGEGSTGCTAQAAPRPRWLVRSACESSAKIS